MQNRFSLFWNKRCKLCNKIHSAFCCSILKSLNQTWTFNWLRVFLFEIGTKLRTTMLYSILTDFKVVSFFVTAGHEIWKASQVIDHQLWIILAKLGQQTLEDINRTLNFSKALSIELKSSPKPRQFNKDLYEVIYRCIVFIKLMNIPFIQK